MRHDTQKGYAGDTKDSIPHVVMIGVPSDEGVYEERAAKRKANKGHEPQHRDNPCLLYTSPSPRDRTRSRMPSSA